MFGPGCWLVHLLCFGGRFRDIAEQVLGLKQTRDTLVQTALVQVIPSLAKLCPERFTSDYVVSCIDYLLQLLYQQKSTPVVLSCWCELLGTLAQLEYIDVKVYRLLEFAQAVDQICSTNGQLEAKHEAIKVAQFLLI